MSNIPEDLRYTEEHEYIRIPGAGDEVVIGITDYAQGELGDIVYVELPGPGDTFDRMEVFGTVEATKTVSDLYSPLSGEIVALNEDLDGSPELVNDDPYGGGWIIKMRMTDPSEADALLSAEAYAAVVSAAEGDG